MNFFYVFAYILILTFSTLSGQVNIEKYRSDEDSSGFSFASEASFTLQKGNVDFQEISLDIASGYRFEKAAIMLAGSGNFGWEDGKRFSNAMLFHVRHVYELSEKIAIESFIQFDYDKERLLDNRELAGAGLRYNLYQSENSRLRLGSSVFYELEQYDLPEQAKHPDSPEEFRLSTYLAYKAAINETLSWNMVFYYQPVLWETNDFKFIGESGLEIKLADHFELVVDFSYRLDNKPPDEVKKQDIQSETGLQFHF